ncbi:MAG: SUMF1/EgtB/PvdO family nonheme iron enzyme, partial [Chitinophagaceae bacterium]
MKKLLLILVCLIFCGLNYCVAQAPSHGDLVITTDEPCTFKIDNKNYPALKKGEKRTISLDNGSYVLLARSAITQIERRISFKIYGDTKRIRLEHKFFLAAVAHPTPPPRTARSDPGSPVKESRDTSNISTHAPPAVVAVNTSPKEPPVKVLSREEVIVRELVSNMKSISSGFFAMGSDLGSNDEGPEHQVSISPFEVGKYEVTQKQWETIMGSNPSINQGCSDCPVENISYKDVEAFISKINKVGSKQFRLPTEAEWEYIADKGSGSKNLKGTSWYSVNSDKKTHPVGTKSPNTLGIYDISGNVAEWCGDWYLFNYYKSKSIENPSGPSSGQNKVVRGG